MGAPRVLNFYGSQLNRISDAISVKRGELLRIKKLLQNRSALLILPHAIIMKT